MHDCLKQSLLQELLNSLGPVIKRANLTDDSQWAGETNVIKLNKEVFVKHEKAPTAPQFEGVFTISYMPVFWKFKAFGQFWPTSGGRNCQKEHIYAKTFHMSLFPGL